VTLGGNEGGNASCHNSLESTESGSVSPRVLTAPATPQETRLRAATLRNVAINVAWR
jgi:hypothetical protein